MKTVERRGAATAVALLVATAGLTGLTSGNADAATCSELSMPVYQALNPTSGAQLLSPWPNEVAGAKNYGFTENRGLVGYGAWASGSGYSPVTRMYNASTTDFVWLANPADISAAQSAGYARQDVIGFAAATTPTACTTPVYRVTRGKATRNAWSDSELATLTSTGWTNRGVAFYLKVPGAQPSATPTPTPNTPTPTPTPTAAEPTSTPTVPGTSPEGQPGTDDPTTFSIAIIGDTQTEVLTDSDRRFTNRTQWLAKNKDALDLRYVLQTGDLSNWGWLVPEQYARAKAATSILTNAGIPFAGAIGNHDARAVGWDGVQGSSGYGGSAYANNPECATRLGANQCHSWTLVRDTEEFRKAYPVSSLKNVGGTYESGKPDNVWTTFSANDTDWLVLTLELWPRQGVVDWAKQVVASHPNHNVIIQTHHYLEGNGTIATYNGGYGATSPKYLYDQVVSAYPNVKIVASGHTGSFTSRKDTVNGNTVVSYLGNDLGDAANPVRIVTINTATGQVTSKVDNPIDETVKGTTSDTITLTRKA
ncbi:metallophosphoesterase [Propioniciclava flava]